MICLEEAKKKSPSRFVAVLAPCYKSQEHTDYRTSVLTSGRPNTFFFKGRKVEHGRVIPLKQTEQGHTSAAERLNPFLQTRSFKGCRIWIKFWPFCSATNIQGLVSDCCSQHSINVPLTGHNSKSPKSSIHNVLTTAIPHGGYVQLLLWGEEGGSAPGSGRPRLQTFQKKMAGSIFQSQKCHQIGRSALGWPTLVRWRETVRDISEHSSRVYISTLRTALDWRNLPNLVQKAPTQGCLMQNQIYPKIPTQVALS